MKVTSPTDCRSFATWFLLIFKQVPERNRTSGKFATLPRPGRTSTGTKMHIWYMKHVKNKLQGKNIRKCSGKCELNIGNVSICCEYRATAYTLLVYKQCVHVYRKTALLRWFVGKGEEKGSGKMDCYTNWKDKHSWQTLESLDTSHLQLLNGKFRHIYSLAVTKAQDSIAMSKSQGDNNLACL